MTPANETQVGGDHYQSAYQHWDMITDHNFGYLEGCATKYLCRWRDKNGVADLLKADHFITKLHEKASNDRRFNFGKISPSMLYRFLCVNEVGVSEAQIIDYLLNWQTTDDLRDVMRMMNKLLKQEDPDYVD